MFQYNTKNAYTLNWKLHISRHTNMHFIIVFDYYFARDIYRDFCSLCFFLLIEKEGARLARLKNLSTNIYIYIYL
jgi:hypothetical protein